MELLIETQREHAELAYEAHRANWRLRMAAIRLDIMERFFEGLERGDD